MQLPMLHEKDSAISWIAQGVCYSKNVLVFASSVFEDMQN